MTSFPHLFSPIRIGPLELRNRIVVSPHTTVFAAPGGYLTQRDADYWEARARGGAALCVFGTNIVHESSTIDYGVLGNFDDSYIPGYRRVADAVHKHGAYLFAQLNHLGASTHSRGAHDAERARLDRLGLLDAHGAPLGGRVANRPLQAPSAVASFIHGEVPHEMEQELIHEVVAAFGAAAERCQRATLDGVLIHAAHGYLINQFLSPLTNRRTDAYGGSLDNRVRLLLEVVASIRAAVGPSFAVGVRLTVDELLPGGLAMDESLEIVRRLDRDGMVDYLDVTCGVDSDWMSHGTHYPGMSFPEATWVHLARQVKASVSIPVSCAGRMRRPEQAEQLLAEGNLDLVQMARALIADPELPNKARDGRLDEIRTCLYISSGCLGRLYRGLPISCVQNPAVGREREYGEIRPAEVRKRIVVVGGGPAGMEATVVALQRGHSVTLFEAADRLGGQMRTAARAPGRDELLLGIEFLERQIERLGADVRLGRAVSVDDVLVERPDEVIVATGSDAAPFESSPTGAPHVWSVREVLDGNANVGQRVVVIDGLGRLAASSTAEFLATGGHEVTIVGRDFAIANNVDHTNRPVVERRLREGGVRQITGTEVLGFVAGSVQLRDSFTGKAWAVDDVDTLVHDLGGRARDSLYRELKDRGVSAHLIGDALAPRDLEEAYHEGFRVALTL